MHASAIHSHNQGLVSRPKGLAGIIMNTFKSLFRRERSLPDVELFSCNSENPQITNGSETYLPYPKKIFLGAKGIFAYHIVMAILELEFNKLLMTINRSFSLIMTDPCQEAIASNNDGQSIRISGKRDFNGFIFEITTNSRSLIEGIDSTFSSPPPPWIVFPKMEAIESVMSKQGTLDYWWTWIWLPFWSHANSDVKSNYLKVNHASEEWTEYLNSDVLND